MQKYDNRAGYFLSVTFAEIKIMKKYGLPAVVVLIAVFVSLYFFGGKKKTEKEPKKDPLTISANTGAFNESFTEALTAYLSLKEAFVASDTAKANKAALGLSLKADSLKIDDIKGDTTGTIKETARFYVGTISASILTLASAKNIEAKRKEFETITDAVWSLTRTVKYSGVRVFYQYCPMAFNNKGAYWISDKREIRNPYFGNKMLTCGEVADSLDYSRK